MPDCVGWSWFCGYIILRADFVQMLKRKLIEFQKYVPISAKVMPWSLWKWIGSQCIFEGQNISNSIGYSPGQARLQTSIRKCSFFNGLKKVKKGSHFFPTVPGVSMRMDTETPSGSTCIQGKLFEKVAQNITKCISPNTTPKKNTHSNLEPVDADCRFLMFGKILEAEYVEHVHLKRFERCGGWRIGNIL